MSSIKRNRSPDGKTQKEKVKEMLGEKISVYKIAQKLGIPESSVRMYVEDLRAEGAIKE